MTRRRSTTGLPRRALAAAAVLASAVALAGCSTAPAGPSASEQPSASAAPSGSITVFAAASLTEVFGQIADDFTAENPGTSVQFNFGGSSGLAEQIVQGAPADLFASANAASMTTVVDAEAVAGDPVDFTSNTIQIVVPTGNPAGITGLADFADADRTIALCAVEVPCGAAGAAAFEAAGLTPAPDTLEQDVKAVLTKVQLGEVDAGLVYRTDVRAAGDAVEGIDFAEAADIVNLYPIAVLAEAPDAELAAAFQEWVLSDRGRERLEEAGFGEL